MLLDCESKKVQGVNSIGLRSMEELSSESKSDSKAFKAVAIETKHEFEFQKNLFLMDCHNCFLMMPSLVAAGFCASV